MKKVILSALIAGVGCIGSAAAAGWNGPYIGIDGGYGWGKAKTPYSAVPGGALSLSQADADMDGWFAGAHAGINWASPGWLFGVEIAGNWNDVGGDDGGSGGDVNGVEGNAEANGSARLGFFWSPVTLMYGRLGYSWFNADVTKTDLPVPLVAKQTTFSGILWGIGMEFKLSPVASGRIEYRRNNYNQERVSMSPLGYDQGPEPTISTVSVGLSWQI